MPSNKLEHEKSPYLLQHAENPVDWFPWGEEAFARARTENKPIFLSIGYSTCHWCHVMAHESFEDVVTAEIMNAEFVNIKVDREERPDVDRVYMTFVQATTGSGGWPMSVWLTPELQPFVGGTYFPPDDRYRQPAFRKVLRHIASAWKQDAGRIREQGAKIIDALRDAGARTSATGEIASSVSTDAYDHFARSFDAQEGGFGNAPKFPRPSVFNFLAHVAAEDRDSVQGQNALEMVTVSLRKMAAGGLHDHVGGGFHRYSVDARWHVPHFEKMLYDQAQLTVAYLEAFQLTGEAGFAETARAILEYVRRDLTAPAGGFFSAEDADSAPAPDERKREGAFYVWTKRELETALGDDAEIFCRHYHVSADGNVQPGSDPHGELVGQNVLFTRETVAETAAHFGRSEADIRALLENARARLHSLRAQRPRPQLDDKIITAWNGLMISAFARAARIFDEKAYLQSATRAALFLRENLYNAEAGILARNFREGRGGDGYADDYVFLIQGLLDLYEASFDLGWLEWAKQLQAKLDEQFFDDERGGYFASTGKDANVLLRMKEDNDSAEPAASSIAALNLARLGAMTRNESLSKRARRTVNAFAPQLEHFPSALPQMLVALDFLDRGAREIVIAGSAEEGQELFAELRKHFLPRAVFVLADGSQEATEVFGEETIAAMKRVDGKTAIYLCQNFSCRAPVTSAGELRELLAK